MERTSETFRSATNEDEAEDQPKSSSSSEGEYHVGSSEFQTPNFSGIPDWNPQGPASLKYMCLVPLSMLQLKYNKSPDEQTRHVNKLKVSATHRQQRMKEFKLGKISGRNIYDEKRLHKAASENQYDVVIELLESGVDPCSCDNKQRSALHFAASQGNELIVKVLLDKGANPNCRDILGNTPMHLAAITGHVPVVTLLLKAGQGQGDFWKGIAWTNWQDILHKYQVFLSTNKCFRLMLDHRIKSLTIITLEGPGTDVKSVDKNGRTPLTLAQARLKVLSTNTNCTSEQLKREVDQISDMMKTYLNMIELKDVTTEEVHELCSRVQRSTTLEEVDEVSNLLSSFAAMTLEKDTHPG